MQRVNFLFLFRGGGNASSVNISGRKDAELVTCHVERLDDFARKNNLQIDFIKCDVEGAELFVFQGAMETLQRDRPIVFAEMLRKWSAKFNYHPNDIVNLFSSLGYQCFYVAGDLLRELKEMTEETVETNFFFLHSLKHKLQIELLGAR